jgi:hypothetical protein
MEMRAELSWPSGDEQPRVVPRSKQQASISQIELRRKRMCRNG